MTTPEPAAIDESPRPAAGTAAGGGVVGPDDGDGDGDGADRRRLHTLYAVVLGALAVIVALLGLLSHVYR